MMSQSQHASRILSVSETLKPDELRSVQEKRLNWTLHQAEKTRLYRGRLPDPSNNKRGPVDLDELPFTTKQQLRELECVEHALAVPITDVQRWHCSSGTSGVRTTMAYTEKDLRLWAKLTARALFAAGVAKGSRVHNAYSYGLFTGGLGFDGGLRKLGAMVIPASNSPSPRDHLQLIERFRAEVLLCTPSCAATLAETLLDRKRDAEHLHVRAGVFGGESWSESLRHRIEQILGLKAYNTYGLSEIIGPGVAHECQEQLGLHIYEDAFLIEVLAIGGFEQVALGMPGELVITTLANEACPRIRYRTGDVVRIDSTPCPCGRTTMRIREVLGRIQDVVNLNGRLLMPMQFERLILKFPELTSNYQIRVSRGDTEPLLIRVEGRRGMEDAQRQTLAGVVEEQLARELLISHLTVRVEPAGRLFRSQGKATRVVYENLSHDKLYRSVN